MEVLGSAPVWVPARIGARAWPVPVRSPRRPESAADRQSGPLGALAEEPVERRVARLAAMVPGTPWASVTVARQRFSARRIWPASARAEAHGETPPSVILAAGNRAPLDWLTYDPRFLTAVYVGREEFPAREGRPAWGGGRLAGRPVTAARADNTRSSGSRTVRMPLRTTMRCPRPSGARHGAVQPPSAPWFVDEQDEWAHLEVLASRR
jgi:hypothetical protein